MSWDIFAVSATMNLELLTQGNDVDERGRNVWRWQCSPTDASCPWMMCLCVYLAACRLVCNRPDDIQLLFRQKI